MSQTLSVGRAVAIAMLAILLAPAWPLLAQQADDKRDGHIYIARPDGSQSKPLPDLPGYDMQGSPCWSSDGSLLAFDGWKHGQGERGPNAKIIVVNADGSQPRVLYDGCMPSFSPRARRICFRAMLPIAACGS